MRIFYNPKTIEAPKENRVYNIQEVDTNDHNTKQWIKLCGLYESYDEMIKGQTTGRVYYKDNDKTYEAQRVTPALHIAVADYAIDPGINWDTYYAPTVEQLQDALCKRFGDDILNFSPCIKKSPFDLYMIQVHYSGRCR